MGLTTTFSELNLVGSSPRVEVTPRRRIWAQQTGTIAASSFSGGFAGAFLQDILMPDDGLLFDHVFGSINPAAPGVAIQSMTLLIATNPFVGIMEIGAPSISAPQPNQPEAVVFAPIPFISARDLDAFCRLRNSTSIFSPATQQPLAIEFVMGFNNTTTGGVGMTWSTGVIYRVVHGLEEG